jgi:YspA, cpYpsA-related SLOG family
MRSPATPDRARVIVSGSRRHDGQAEIWQVLDRVYRRAGPLVIVHGAAAGADTICAQWAAARAAWGWQVTAEAHPARWRDPRRPQCDHRGRRTYPRGGGTYCPAAGGYRNREMVDAGAAGYVAFPLPGSVGTYDLINYAESKGIRDLAVAA